jgi:hypothetical protein
MRSYLRFFQDKSFLSAIFILILIEISMQFGCYRIFQKKTSYGANVNRIIHQSVNEDHLSRTNVLILGTSLAYEGISVNQLNETLNPIGYHAHSIALPGAELIVQSLVLDDTLQKYKNIEYIIHVNEAEMPWVNFNSLSHGTIAMLAEFNPLKVNTRIQSFKYIFDKSSLLQIYVKLVTYRKDIADLILNPDRRYKEIMKKRKIINDSNANNYSIYENEHTKSMSLYKFNSIDECIIVTEKSQIIPIGSDIHQQDALHKTCVLTKATSIGISKSELTDLYKNRLRLLYTSLDKKKIKVIHVFPPLPYYLDYLDYPKRIQFWKDEYSSILYENILDFNDDLPRKESPKYFYDLVHPNKIGKEYFTSKLGNSVKRIILQNRNKEKK